MSENIKLCPFCGMDKLRDLIEAAQNLLTVVIDDESRAEEWEGLIDALEDAIHEATQEYLS